MLDLYMVADKLSPAIFFFLYFFLDLFCIVEVPARNLLKSSGGQMKASGSHAEPLRSSILTPPDTPKLMAVV